MAGKVWLVGAGPGCGGLFTLRGRQVLEEADTVVCDALVGQEILRFIPDRAVVIYAGKRAGRHTLPQEEINRILLDEALKGRRVVRLKGGDPFLFGRGGEELELLARNGIPFEVVPGVTSALAVPAYCGIPVTHRDYSAAVHILTGHRRKDGPLDIPFDALVRAGGTLVFLMGVGTLSEICNGLLSAGMDPSTPAAALEQGTTAEQRRIAAPLRDLEEVCKSAAVRTPAILVVGAVCALADRFQWAERRPLDGVRVLVTRPRELISSLADLLRREGAEALELPAIETRPLDDGTDLNASADGGTLSDTAAPDTIGSDTAASDTAAPDGTASDGTAADSEASNGNGTIADCIQRLEQGGWDWLVFTSPSGVRIFMEKLLKITDMRALGGVRVAALGEGTRKALSQAGIRADFLPSAYDGETLGRELAQVCEPHARILIPRAKIGNPELTDALRRGGDFSVTDLPIYETVYADPAKLRDTREALEQGRIHFAVFTSASTVRGFAAALGDMDFSLVRAVCIGRQTAAAAAELGMKIFVSEKAALSSLVERVTAAARECGIKGTSVEADWVNACGADGDSGGFPASTVADGDSGGFPASTGADGDSGGFPASTGADGDSMKFPASEDAVGDSMRFPASTGADGEDSYG